jgi:hypothetical protein
MLVRNVWFVVWFYDRLCQPFCLGAIPPPPWGPWPDSNFICLTVTFLSFRRDPLWWEDRSVIFSTFTLHSLVELIIILYCLVCQSHIAADGRPVSMSWCRASYGAHDHMFVNCLTVTVLSYSGALSDEWSGLSFVSHSLTSLSMRTQIIYMFDKFFYIQYMHKSLPVQDRYSRLCSCLIWHWDPRIYIPHGQGGPVLAPGMGSLFVTSYDSQV